MSETKSYGISLSFSDRLSLYISGALSWSQFKNDDPFYIQQSEIQILTNVRLNPNKFICFFERDLKIHHLSLDKKTNSSLYTNNQSFIRSWSAVPTLVFRYQVVPIIALICSIFLIFTFSFFLNFSSFSRYYLSDSCDPQCADLMGKFSMMPALFSFYAFGIPTFYFAVRFILKRSFKFKSSPPILEFFFLTLMILPETILLNDSLSHPAAQVVFNHWRSGTLNQKTITKIKTEFKSKTSAKRTAAAASEKPTE